MVVSYHIREQIPTVWTEHIGGEDEMTNLSGLGTNYS